MFLLFSLKGFQKTIEPSKWVSSPKNDENRLWYTSCTSKIKMADEQKNSANEKNQVMRRRRLMLKKKKKIRQNFSTKTMVSLCFSQMFNFYMFLCLLGQLISRTRDLLFFFTFFNYFDFIHSKDPQTCLITCPPLSSCMVGCYPDVSDKCYVHTLNCQQPLVT